MLERLARRLIGALRARLPDLRLERVRDPRRRPKSVRWSLPHVLRALVVGLVAGCKSLADLESLTAELTGATRKALGLRGRLPDTTTRDILVALDPGDLRASLVQQVRQAHRRKALEPEGLPFGVVSMDGKATSIDAWDDAYAQRQRHGGSATGVCGLVRTITSCLISSRARICIDAAPIPPATNEAGHYPEALTELADAYGSLDLFRMVMYDAGACSEANARFTRSLNLHYTFCLNPQQPTLFAEAKRTLRELRHEQADAVHEEMYRGRIVRRCVFLTEQLAGFLDWPHLKTVVRIRSEVLDATGRPESTEDRYYVSSLRAQALTPEQWNELIRRRWSVENHCHHTWDVAFEEDARPWITASPRGAVVVMLLRRLAFNFMALYRSVTLRSEESRLTPWRILIRRFYLAMITATDSACAALRQRRPPPLEPD